MSLELNLMHDQSLSERLEENPADWKTRLRTACLLYDQDALHKAATLVLEAPQIPSTDLDLASAARILAKNQPRKAIRLLTAVCENNRGKAEQNLAMANALLNQGMVLESARFYGAALEINPNLVNPELEHFILWTDDEQSMWGGIKGPPPPTRRTAMDDARCKGGDEAHQPREPTHHSHRAPQVHDGRWSRRARPLLRPRSESNGGARRKADCRLR